jgi:hypothetical protein
MAGQRVRLLREHLGEIAGLRVADDDQGFICAEAAAMAKQMIDGDQIGLWSVNGLDLCLCHSYLRQRQTRFSNRLCRRIPQ